jgi:2,5-diketo-D-gluconate reductase A
VNQVELHPYLRQAELRAYHAEHGIVTEVWSPLGQGGALLSDPVIESIAAAHARTPAQAVLRWHLQLGNVTMPKSVTPERIRENFDVFDFELSGDEMEQIAGLDRGARLGPDPDRFAVA